MERNAHYALVGMISMGLVLLAVVFTFWLAKFQFTRQYDVYDVAFKGPIRGLSVGGQVFFNGIRVGETTKLSLDKTDPNRIVARIRVTADSPVRTDSTATLEPLGITGVNYIEISAGTPAKPLLKDVARPGHPPVIPSKSGALESLLEGGGDVLTRTVQALDRVNRVLSDKNIASLTGSLDDIHAVTRELRDRKAMLADLDQTIKSANETIQKIGKLSDQANGLLSGDGRRTIKDLADAAEEIKATAADVRGTVAKVQGPTTDFAADGLPRITQAIIALQRAAESLDRVVQEIEANPQGVIGKAPAQQREVKP